MSKKIYIVDDFPSDLMKEEQIANEAIEELLDKYSSYKTQLNKRYRTLHIIRYLSTAVSAVAAALMMTLSSTSIEAWKGIRETIFVIHERSASWRYVDSLDKYGSSISGMEELFVPNIIPAHWLVVDAWRKDGIHCAFENDQYPNYRAYYEYTEQREVPLYPYDRTIKVNDRDAQVIQLPEGNIMMIVRGKNFAVTIAGDAPVEEMAEALRSVPILE